MNYSASTGGFYDEAIHGANIPSDATDESAWAYSYAQLLEGQSNGKRITADADGKPILTDPAAPTTEELAVAVRAQRDALLAACDWTVLPDSPLAAEKQAEWKVYRQALRDITSQADFPTAIVWPDAPQ